VPVLLRLHLTVLTFPEISGVLFKIFILLLLLICYYLENGESYCGVSIYIYIYIYIYTRICIPYMSCKTYWMKSVLTQVYKVRIPPCTESRATELQVSEIFIQIHSWERLMDVLYLRCVHV